VDTHIQLIAYQQHQGIDIDKKHEDEDGSDRAINLVITTKVIYPERKKKCG
jgi:hypothetical protein